MHYPNLVMITLIVSTRARSSRGRVTGVSVRISVCLFGCLCHKSEEFEQTRPEHELYLQFLDQKWKCLTFCVPHDRE